MSTAEGLAGIAGSAEISTEAEARRRLTSNPGSAQARFELGVVLAASGQYEPARN